MYGLESENLDELAAFIAIALGVQLEFRSSDFLGDYYKYGEKAGENIKFQRNYYEGEDAWQEPEFRGYPILLYVNRTQRAEEVSRLLLGALESHIKLLRRKVIREDE